MEGRTRDDYSYIAILKSQRQAIEKTLGEDSERYGYRDFSSFCKNLFGYYIEYWEKNNNKLIESKDYSVQQVANGGQKYGQPYTTKTSCQCDCHPAFEILKKVKKNRIKDRELIESVEQLEAKEVKK